MKKSILLGISALAFSTLLVSCHDEFGTSASKGSGSIAPSINLDKNLTTSRSTDNASRADEAVDVQATDLALRLTYLDGEGEWNWSSVAEFDKEKQFKVGNYLFAAYYGDVNEQGFNLPSYYGEQKIVVEDKATTPVSVTATMSKSMVTLKYTDAFRNYMADWGATVNAIEYGKDETRPVYVTPGNVEIKISVTKPNGVGGVFTLDPVEAKARYHYTVTVDVNEGNVGDAVLKITYDENLEAEEIEIDLSDKLLLTPAPTIKAKGFTSEEAIDILAGSAPDNDLKMDVLARAKMKEVKLKTHSVSLLKQGWPEEVNLISDGQQLKAFGFDAIGLWNNPDQMAQLDFTGVIKKIGYVTNDDNTVTFTVTVKDNLMRESEASVLALNIETVQLQLESAGVYYNPGEPLDVVLLYNGKDVKENVKFEYYNAHANVWNSVGVTSVSQPSRAMSNYKVTLDAPALDDAIKVRATSGGVISNVLEVGFAPYAISFSENNVFANHAYVDVIAINGVDTPSKQASEFVFQVFNATTGKFENVNSTLVDGIFKVEGLTPGAKARMRVLVDGNPSKPSVVSAEQDVQVPNGDFEQAGNEFKANSINVGGQWSVSSGINYQNYANYTFTEAKGWATTNAKTLNGYTTLTNAQNTWFNQPSVFNSSITYSSTVPPIRVVNTGGGTETPASFKGFAAHGGDNAMVIRNVGWDANGTVPGVWLKLFAGSNDYYNHTEPTVANNSVGKMFLGTYGYLNGNESYNEGISFTSRPSALTGWYTYTPDKNDTGDNGVVTVEILNGNTVIASGKADLTSTDTYKQFTINLKYELGASKATSLRLKVESSKHGSTVMADETSAVKVSTYMSRYESYKHGATLVVDDFKFVY